jgi:hypothetical protein
MRRIRKAHRLAGWHAECEGKTSEAIMNPFFAALVAASYMAAVFVVFGVGARFVGKTR